MTLNVIAIGAIAHNLRKEQGLTQAQLAKKSGVSRKWLVEFEQGKPEAQLWKVLDVLENLGQGITIVGKA